MNGAALYIMLLIAGAGIWQVLERVQVIQPSCIVEQDLFQKAKR